MQNNLNVSIFTVFTLIVFLSSNQLSSQNNLAKQVEKLKKNAVAIQAYFANDGDEKGFGFIVGEQNNHLYIVTAAHVVRGVYRDKNADSIRVKLYVNSLTWPWELVSCIDYWEKEDLALLRLLNKPPLFNWERDYADLQPHTGQKVRFIGSNSNEPSWVDRGLDGNLFQDVNHELHFAIPTISPGTSGAPLITDKGIIGMIIKDDGSVSTALKMDKILKLFQNSRNYNFDLRNIGNTILNPNLKNLPTEEGFVKIYDPIKGWVMVQTRLQERLDTIHWKDSNIYPGPISSTVRPHHSYPFIPMVKVEGGVFEMGCTGEQASDCEENEKPSRRVLLSDFYIGKYEVTQAQWRSVMGSDPPNLAFPGCDQCPVERVNWIDIQKFIQKLNNKTGKNYRLPREAEWEYAARGGKLSRGFKYAGSNVLGNVAWFSDGSSRTHPVGEKGGNELGLYDMSGNVLEWCQDWYGGYPNNSQKDPIGASSGAMRVYRGGSWSDNTKSSRVSKRNGIAPTSSAHNLGFRIAL